MLNVGGGVFTCLKTTVAGSDIDPQRMVSGTEISVNGFEDEPS